MLPLSIRFFDGVPCRHGHVDERGMTRRYLRGGACVACEHAKHIRRYRKRQPKPPRVDPTRVYALRDEGASLKQIARIFNVSHQAIAHHLAKRKQP